MMNPAPLVEAAIALVWKEGRLLVSRRRQDTHLGGLWEFPGGRRQQPESFENCAEREVYEETGVICRAYHKRASIRHDYPDRGVLLCPVDCRFISGEAEPREVSEVCWVVPSELSRFEFPAANRELIRRLAAQAQGKD